MKKTYKLELYKPTGEYAGILDVYNLNVNLSIEKYSTISFNIAAYIDEEENMRLFDVFDLYEVALEIGKQKKRYRFVLRSIPASFDSSGPRYTYEGLSTESDLDKKIISGWLGAKRTIEFYHKIFKAPGTYPSPPLNNVTFSLSLGDLNGSAAEIADQIEVMEIREYDDFIKRTPLVYQTDGAFFKRGTYNIVKNGNDLDFTIAKYELEDLFENKDTDKRLLSDDLGIYYHVFLKPPFEASEDGESGLLLISDAAEKAEYELMSSYIDESTNTVEYYTNIGVTLREVLKDFIQEDSELSPLPKNVWSFNIDDSLSLDLKRSDFEFNNISIYQILEEIKKSFDVIYILDTDNRTITFYKKYEDYSNNIVNNIILGEGAYLKSIEKTLDTGDIATNIYGIGKDYISTAMFSPSKSWFDFSYYLDEYWTEINKVHSSDILYAFLYVDTIPLSSSLESKWMSKSDANKIAIWQSLRDIIVEIYFGRENIDSYEFAIDNKRHKLLKKAFNIIEKREKELEKLAKLESKYTELDSEAKNYESLAEFADRKRNNILSPTLEVDQANIDYERFNVMAINLRNQANLLLPQIEGLEEKLLKVDIINGEDELDLYYSYILLEIQKELEDYLFTDLGVSKAVFEKFRFDYLLQDDTVATSKDLLEKVKEYAAENAKPKVTLNVDIVDILAAYDVSEEDKENLFVGNHLYVNFPMFNIDEKAQIKSMSIDFDSNSISLEISTVERYATGLLQKMIKNIRTLGVNYQNIGKYKEDENKRSKEIIKRTETIIDGGYVSEQEIANDEETMIIDNSGLSVGAAEIDYDKETIRVLHRDDRIVIGSGEIFMEKTYTSKELDEEGVVLEEGISKAGLQVIMSLDEGFVINAIEWYDPEKEVKKLENIFRVTTSGNMFLKGEVESSSGNIGGWKIDKDRLFNDNQGYIGLHTYDYDGKSAFIAGGSSWDDDKTKFAVDFEGNLKAVDAEIMGIITAEKGSYFGDFVVNREGLFYQEGYDGDLYRFDTSESGAFLQLGAVIEGNFLERYSFYMNQITEGSVDIFNRINIATDNPNRIPRSHIFEGVPERSSAIEIWRGIVSDVQAKSKEGVILDPVALTFYKGNEKKGQSSVLEKQISLIYDSFRDRLTFEGQGSPKYLFYSRLESSISRPNFIIDPDNASIFFKREEGILNRPVLDIIVDDSENPLLNLGLWLLNEKKGLTIKPFENIIEFGTIKTYMSNNEISFERASGRKIVFDIDNRFLIYAPGVTQSKIEMGANKFIFFGSKVESVDKQIIIDPEEQSITFIGRGSSTPIVIQRSGGGSGQSDDLLLNGKKILTET